MTKIAAYVAQTNLEIIGTEIYGENCTYATVERLRALPCTKRRTWSLAWEAARPWIR